MRETEIAQNLKAKKLHGTVMPNCWELKEIFTASIATGEMVFEGSDLKDRFPGEWKKREPTGRKNTAKGMDTPSTSLLLTKAVEEFRASQAAMGSSIRLAVRRVMDIYRGKAGCTRGKINQALDVFKEEAMAEIFNELETDPEYQEHWLNRQIA